MNTEQAAADMELVDRFLNGDASAFDEIVNKYAGKVYGLAYNMFSNREDADDVVQEVFLKVYRSVKRFKRKSSFYTWLYRIALNTAINALKKKRRRQSMSFDNIDEGVERDPDYLELSARHTPLRDTSLNELQEKLNEALQKLSDKHRTVVIMHDIEGIPHEEIGKMLGCSAGTVRSRLFYAHQQLQVELKDYAS